MIGFAFVYLGDCITGLEDPDFQNLVAYDATEMAQLIENSATITNDEFVKAVTDADAKHCNKDFEYGRSEEGSVIWAYDTDADIHYFYVLLPLTGVSNV